MDQFLREDHTYIQPERWDWPEGVCQQATGLGCHMRSLSLFSTQKLDQRPRPSWEQAVDDLLYMLPNGKDRKETLSKTACLHTQTNTQSKF